MTIIQPHKNLSPLGLLFVVLVCAVAIAGITVVVQYNRFVNTEHRTIALAERIEKTKAANVELQSQIFGMSSGDNLERMAADLGLVREKNPSYVLSATAPWLASR